MQNMKKILAIVVVLLMVLPFALACQKTEAPAAEEPSAEQPVAEEPATEEPAATENKPLVVAYSPFSAKFSPFYADTGYDQDVVAMTQLALLTTDRMGGIIYNAIEGETVNYNGTDYLYTGISDVSVNYDEAADQTTYTAKLKEGVLFSDGVEMTADDIIFTYYTLLDPTYVGSTTLSSYDIVGLQDYQTQTSSEVYDKYAALAADIFAAGSEGYVANEAYTQEQYDGYWAKMKEQCIAACQGIVNYVMNKYGSDDYIQAYFKADMTAADISANDGLKVAYGMSMWGFGGFDDAGAFVDAAGDSFDLTATFPTIEDYYKSTMAKYENDIDACWGAESANGEAPHAETDAWFISEYGSKDEAMGGKGVASVAGITKIDKYTVQVVTNGYEAPAVYSILGIQVAPMHYYGDEAKYDYDNGMYGFDYGDLSKQKSTIEAPMGAGAYKFVSYENKVVTFAANENYYKGCPKIAEIQFKETASAEVATAVSTGEVDAGEMTGSKQRFAEVAALNSNGEITGDVITTSKVDNLGYGYIGMNADTVNIGGTPDSDASKALRKALATVLAVYRDVAFDSYYGEAASVIQYPISNTSWAAPQATDDGYQLAFSVDAAGNALYTDGMSPDDKYAAAAAGALSWFEAAGYTVADGKVTAAPAGGKLEYTVIIPADGVGDHPSYTVLTMARDAFEQIGITLTIDDPADSNLLWDALDAGSQELWCAAWGSTIDPDMYQVYHSSGVVGEGGSDSNHYHIRDSKLDELIVAARKSDDQSYRKQVYKQCLDIIVDWAVEVPAYQRQNCIIFSTERINISTLTPDITTFWGWLNDIELIEMN